MNAPTSTKKNPFILFILTFMVLGFLIGTLVFFKSDAENKTLKAALLSEGIRTKAYISSKSREEDRRYSANSSTWQYSSTHFILFKYQHLMEQEENKLSLAYHLSKDKDSKKTSAKSEGLGRLEAQGIVDEALYNSLQPGASIDVIYLAGNPASVKIVNKEGGVNIPMLSIFSYICLFLTIASAYMFYFYLKTGRTF